MPILRVGVHRWSVPLPPGPNPPLLSAGAGITGSFKSNQHAPRPVFLRVWRHVTRKQHFRSKHFAPRSWWSCSATASGSPAARAGDTGAAHPIPTLDFFRAISAGECLLVSTVTPCGAKLNSLSPGGGFIYAPRRRGEGNPLPELCFSCCSKISGAAGAKITSDLSSQLRLLASFPLCRASRQGGEVARL
jgi:hypothetical protein